MVSVNKFKIIDFNLDHGRIIDSVNGIYSSLNLRKPEIESIMKSISSATFTKKGEYYISLLGNVKSGDIGIFVCNGEIKRKASIYVKLPNIKFKPHWFGLLGYQIKQV